VIAAFAHEEIKTLPEDYAAEVLDFVGYFKEKAAKRQEPQPNPKGVEPEVRGSPLEGCPICAKHRDPVTGELRFNAETIAGMQEVEDMISGKIPVKWHSSLEDLDKMLEL
jgi:hypothetical protein